MADEAGYASNEYLHAVILAARVCLGLPTMPRELISPSATRAWRPNVAATMQLTAIRNTATSNLPAPRHADRHLARVSEPFRPAKRAVAMVCGFD